MQYQLELAPEHEGEETQTAWKMLLMGSVDGLENRPERPDATGARVGVGGAVGAVGVVGPAGRCTIVSFF